MCFIINAITVLEDSKICFLLIFRTRLLDSKKQKRGEGEDGKGRRGSEGKERVGVKGEGGRGRAVWKGTRRVATGGMEGEGQKGTARGFIR